MQRDRIALERHIFPVLGGYPVGRISEADVQDLVNVWTTTMAASSVVRNYGALRSLLNFALRRRIVARTPLADIGLPKVEMDDRAPLTAVQVRAIADATDEHYRPLVIVLAATGMRVWEALGLRLRNLDIDSGFLRVTEQLAPNGRSWSPPKSRAGRRSIPLAQIAIEALEKYLVGCERGPDEPVSPPT